MYHSERRNRFSKFQGSFGPQRAFGQLEIEYADGTREVIGTDEVWRVHTGPVTYNDIYGGEDYDARLVHKLVGMNRVLMTRLGASSRTCAAQWRTARANLQCRSRSVRSKSSSRCNIDKRSDSQDVVDLGQNASFMPRITVTGPAGSTVRLTHAEVVDDKGNIDRGTCGGNRGAGVVAVHQSHRWRGNLVSSVLLRRLPLSAGR